MSRIAAVFLALYLHLIAHAADPVTDTAARQAQEGNCAGSVQTLAPLLSAAAKPADGVYILLAKCQMTLGRLQEAEQALRDGLRAHPESAILQRALGQLLFRQRADSVEAGELLGRAAKALPRDPESRHYYAQWALLNSRERICVEQEQAALQLPGLNDLALLQMYTLLGMCASPLEDSSTAQQAFEKANAINLRLGSYDPVAAWQYVQYLNRFGKEEKVQAVVDEILSRMPQFAPAHLERAKLYDRGRQPEKAIEEARLTLKTAGNDANLQRAAHGILAKSYVALGQNAEADLEQRWIEAHPNPETLQTR